MSVFEVAGPRKTSERRTVPFPEFLADDLAALMVHRSRDAVVFTGSGGAVIRLNNGRRRVFLPAVMAARFDDPEFPEVTPHDLRHTAASLAISAGANVKAVQTMLGHASAAMTLDTDADPLPTTRMRWPHGSMRPGTLPSGRSVSKV